MQIKNRFGDVLDTLPKWKAGFERVDKGHWAPGYSAHSLALFFTERGGMTWLDKMSRTLFGEAITWDEARIEHESKLDSLPGGRHRMQDLAMWGTLSSGQTVFMGIEAKVLEHFGEYNLKDEYNKALVEKEEKRRVNKNCNKPERVLGVTSFLFPGKTPFDEDICSLRYQLMHYFTGSIKEAASYEESCKSLNKRTSRVDTVVLPVVVFKTAHYYEDPEVGEGNKADYDSFCEALGLNKENVGGKEVLVGMIDGRKVITFYEAIEL